MHQFSSLAKELSHFALSYLHLDIWHCRESHSSKAIRKAVVCSRYKFHLVLDFGMRTLSINDHRLSTSLYIETIRFQCYLQLPFVFVVWTFNAEHRIYSIETAFGSIKYQMCSFGSRLFQVADRRCSTTV